MNLGNGVNIYAHTGVPGSGKSNEVVDQIEHNPAYKDALVYAHAIEGWDRALPLCCSHPGCRACRKLTPEQRSQMKTVETWFEWVLPGTILVIDEAHYAFPQRRESDCPLYIVRMTESRHDGVIFWLITPNANLLDINVRRLIQVHRHFVNGLLGRWTYTHTEVMANDAALKMGHKERFRLKSRSFGKYKSADAHVKLEKPVPKFLYYGAVGVVVFVAAVWFAFHQSQVLRHSTVPAKTVVEVQQGKMSSADQKLSDDLLKKYQLLPQHQEDSSLSTVEDVKRPVVQACISAPTHCNCYDARAFPVHVSNEQCQLASRGQLDPMNVRVVVN